MINNKGVSLAQLNASFPTTAIAANTLHIALFKGTQPKLSKAYDALAVGATNAIYNWQAVCTALGLVQTDMLGNMACSALTPVVNATSRTLTLPFGGIASTLTGVADGTPTFYVARLCAANTAATWAGFNNSANITGPFWIGSVGSDGSDAELQFIGGKIKTGQAYRFLDLTIQL